MSAFFYNCADLVHFDADPDSSFYLYVDQDPIFHLDADPNSYKNADLGIMDGDRKNVSPV